jgi:hypothetical protein
VCNNNLLLHTSLTKGIFVQIFAAGLFVEAAVVAVVCVIFLILFVVAGIKQILNNDGRD